MERYQKGNVYEAFGAFHVRWYQNGKLMSQKLCGKEPQYEIKRLKVQGRKRKKVYLSAALALKRDEFMRTVNEQRTHEPQQDMTVAAFWKNIYLPYVEANKQASTVHGYKKIWEQHLKEHFGEKTVLEYKTYTASEFLTQLAKDGLGQRSLQHIRSL